MKKSIIVLSFLFFLTTTIAQVEKYSFKFEGISRNYEVYRPQDYQPNMPVVLALHGHSETIKWFKDYTLFHEYADTSGIILVYPQGSENGWNSGWYHPSYNYPTSNDVGFISALIDTLETNYDIDLSRVYCCGFSAGGEMSFRLIGEIGYRFAAAASVSGLLFDLANSWEIVRPIPILQMNGTSDVLSPYDGDQYTWSVKKTLEYWLEKNQCIVEADTVNFPDIVQSDNCRVQKISYTNCSGESNVVHYKGIGMGHSWPGSTDIGSTSLEGNKNKDINANVEILNFFKDCQNPLVNLAYGTAIQCYPKFISPLNNNTIELIANIHNPEKHEVDVYASILLEDSVVADSIILYDDGLHNDELASDNIFGAKKQFTYLEENIYSIELHTNDLVDSISLLCLSKDYFTTAGPLVWKDYAITQQNDSVYSMKVTLENNSSSFTVPDISARLSTNDSNITDILSNYNPLFYPDIEPGQSVQSLGTYGYVLYTKNSPEIVDFTLDIYSDNILYWTDTLMVDFVTDVEHEILNLPNEYKLNQNYPNPFNPSTTINYSIPKHSNVTLKVFDVLGSEVTTLVNKEQTQGNFEIEFDGKYLTSGIYFYRLQAGDFVETKKMILIK